MELILTNKGDRSYETLARDCGGVPTAGRLQQIAGRSQELKNFPDPQSIRGLARGLGVTEGTVVSACAESLGLKGASVAAPRLATLIPVDADVIPERGQDAVLSVVRAMLAREYEVTDAAEAITVAAARGHLQELDERARRDLERLTGESLPGPPRGGRRRRKGDEGEREVS